MNYKSEQKTSSNGPFWSFFFRLYSQSSGGRDFSVKLFSLAKELYKDLRENAFFPVLKVEESGAIVFSPITKLDEIKVENN